VNTFSLFARVAVNLLRSNSRPAFGTKLGILTRNLSMERTYDIFEVLPDKSLLWRECISQHEAALARMRTLAEGSVNGFVLIHLATNAVVAVLEAKQTPGGSRTEEHNKPGGGGDTKLATARLYLLWAIFRRFRARHTRKWFV
jgi:hypothetical protein